MKTPIDVVKGRIVAYDERTGEVTIRATYHDWPVMLKRGYSECLIQMLDGRPLSNKQRNTCYKLIREIADFTGAGLDPTKERMKMMFLQEDLHAENIEDFSLSDAPMSLACSFQRFLVRFMLDWDIPASFPLLDFADDVHDYIYACLVHKKCCICGKPSELHHVDRIGMGRDRDDVVHEGMEALPLCRFHHNEVHQMGERRFYARHHIDGGIILDADLCRIYELKRKEESEDAESHCPDGTPDP